MTLVVLRCIGFDDTRDLRLCIGFDAGTGYDARPVLPADAEFVQRRRGVHAAHLQQYELERQRRGDGRQAQFGDVVRGHLRPSLLAGHAGFEQVAQRRPHLLPVVVPAERVPAHPLAIDGKFQRPPGLADGAWSAPALALPFGLRCRAPVEDGAVLQRGQAVAA
jgi:hypothetical protein